MLLLIITVNFMSEKTVPRLDKSCTVSISPKRERRGSADGPVTYINANCTDHSESVEMRSSSIRPVADVDNTAGNQNDTGLSDNMDGIDPLDPNSFAPLLSQNQFTVRKMAAQALMDVALMMANISQLRTLITAGDHMENYYVLLVLVSFSLAAQIFFAILIFIIWIRESDHQQKEDYLATLRQVGMMDKGDTANATRTKSEQIRLSLLKKEETFREHRITNHLNHVTMVLVFVITVANMFVTGFGIKLSDTA